MLSELAFSPANRPVAKRPHEPHTEVHMDKKRATTAPTVSQLALPWRSASLL